MVFVHTLHTATKILAHHLFSQFFSEERLSLNSAQTQLNYLLNCLNCLPLFVCIPAFESPQFHQIVHGS